MSARAAVRTSMASLAALVAGVGCLSVDPVDFQPDARGAFDASIDSTFGGDGDNDGGDADGTFGCYQCIAAPDDPGPGCGTEFDACEAQPECKAILTCVFEKGCFYLSTTKGFVVCAIPCATDAGVTSTDDPIVQLGLNVAYCVDKTCRAFCGGGDAGT